MVYNEILQKYLIFADFDSIDILDVHFCFYLSNKQVIFAWIEFQLQLFTKNNKQQHKYFKTRLKVKK